MTVHPAGRSPPRHSVPFSCARTATRAAARSGSATSVAKAVPRPNSVKSGRSAKVNGYTSEHHPAFNRPKEFALSPMNRPAASATTVITDTRSLPLRAQSCTKGQISHDQTGGPAPDAPDSGAPIKVFPRAFLAAELPLGRARRPAARSDQADLAHDRDLQC